MLPGSCTALARVWPRPVPGWPGGGVPGWACDVRGGREGDTGVRGGERWGGAGVPRAHPVEVPPDAGLWGGCRGPAAPRPSSSEDTGPRAAALRCAHAFTPPPLPVPSPALGDGQASCWTRDVPGNSSRCPRCHQSLRESPRHPAAACDGDPGCCRLGAAACSAPQGPDAAPPSAGLLGFAGSWSRCPSAGCPLGEGRAPCPCRLGLLLPLMPCPDEGAGGGFGTLEGTRSDSGWAGR